jgi:hypothetical protein
LFYHRIPNIGHVVADGQRPFRASFTRAMFPQKVYCLHFSALLEMNVCSPDMADFAIVSVPRSMELVTSMPESAGYLFQADVQSVLGQVLSSQCA